MNNGNWAKTLLFTLIGFGLGWAICCLTCGRCGGGGCEQETSCHAGTSQCDHGGKCCSGKGVSCDKKDCDHKMGVACCKGGHGHGHGKGMGDDHVKVIVSDLEKGGFKGDTIIAIEGGTVHVSRLGDSTKVRVEIHEEQHVH